MEEIEEYKNQRSFETEAKIVNSHLSIKTQSIALSNLLFNLNFRTFGQIKFLDVLQEKLIQSYQTFPIVFYWTPFSETFWTFWLKKVINNTRNCKMFLPFKKTLNSIFASRRTIISELKYQRQLIFCTTLSIGYIH